MHPPFGFALFYLRSVAPAKDYIDRVTRQADRARSPPGRSTGARCRSCMIQVIMVGADHRVPADGDGLQGRREGISTSTRSRSSCRSSRPSRRPAPGAGQVQQQPPGGNEQEQAEEALEKALGGGRRRHAERHRCCTRRAASSRTGRAIRRSARHEPAGRGREGTGARDAGRRHPMRQGSGAEVAPAMLRRGATRLRISATGSITAAPALRRPIQKAPPKRGFVDAFRAGGYLLAGAATSGPPRS